MTGLIAGVNADTASDYARVNAMAPPKQGVPVEIRLPEDLLAEVDRRARAKGISRAEAIRRMLTWVWTTQPTDEDRPPPEVRPGGHPGAAPISRTPKVTSAPAIGGRGQEVVASAVVPPRPTSPLAPPVSSAPPPAWGPCGTFSPQGRNALKCTCGWSKAAHR